MPPLAENRITRLEVAIGAAINALEEAAVADDPAAELHFLSEHFLAAATAASPATLELANLRHLTAMQREANAKAAAHIAKVAETTGNTESEDRKPAVHPYLVEQGITCWDDLAGNVIEELLEHTPLIDLEYIVTLAQAGGVMPCGLQNVPSAALIKKHNLWRLQLWGKKRLNNLPVLVFSYPWLDWYHPDRLGAQLKRLLPFLAAMLEEAKMQSPACTVGVMIDFMCLPQKPFDSESQKEEFKRSLSTINEWYFHKYTYVLLVTNPPPKGAEYGNLRLHRDRGWCFFEHAASMVASTGDCLLDFSAHDSAHTHDFMSSVHQMRIGRRPPFSPITFGEVMRESVNSGKLKFTAAADMNFVVGQYEKGFIKMINRIALGWGVGNRFLSFYNLGWGNDEQAKLVEALQFAAERCSFPKGPVRIKILRPWQSYQHRPGGMVHAPGYQWHHRLRMG
eukprot:6568968-Prymnesium_polylepis.1